MRGLGIICNVFVPGLGTLLVGKIGQGIIQLVLFFVAFVLTVLAITAIIGLPLWIGVWIWALVTVIDSPKPPTRRFRD